jgi:hypothetical protein
MTLKDAIIEKGIIVKDFTAFESEMNQTAEIVDMKEKNGIMNLLVNFTNETANPSKPTGLRVVSIEEDFIYDIDKDLVKHIFNA